MTHNSITAVNLLKLLLRKLGWLQRIDEEPRPFAYMLTPRGETRRASEIPLLGSGGQVTLF